MCCTDPGGTTPWPSIHFGVPFLIHTLSFSPPQLYPNSLGLTLFSSPDTQPTRQVPSSKAPVQNQVLLTWTCIQHFAKTNTSQLCDTVCYSSQQATAQPPLLLSTLLISSCPMLGTTWHDVTNQKKSRTCPSFPTKWESTCYLAPAA